MKHKPVREDSVEVEFLNALERLKAGRPLNKDLSALAKAGNLRITVSSVAKEAGRSRTLIGYSKCEYPHVRDKILAMRHGEGEPTRLHDIIIRKRQETAQLKREMQHLVSYCAALLVRTAQLEEEKERLERQLKRVSRGR